MGGIFGGMIQIYRSLNNMLSLEELKDTLPDPIWIVSELDKYIVGQEDAKRTLALMLLNRAILKLRRANLIHLEVPIKKSNVMLIGPTGTGKTALMKALSLISGIPISVNDVTSITSAGYIGSKVEDILANHINICEEYVSSNYNALAADYYLSTIKPTQNDLLLETVETGIIYLDEIDKICAKVEHGRDINGDSVQNELLKIIENGNVSLRNCRTIFPKSSILNVKTDDVIFVCGGAFSGLTDIIQKRISSNGGIGFHANVEVKSKEKQEGLLKLVITEDLVKYGFKPEFLGRIPLRAGLSSLSVDTLIQIMKEPKNSLLKQYTGLFTLFGIDLVFEEDAFREVAEYAMAAKMGARALQGILNTVLEDDLFNVFTNKNTMLIITKEQVTRRCGKRE